MAANKMKFKDFVDSCQFPEKVTKKERHEYVKLVFDAIGARLSEGKSIGVNGFGTFDTVERKAKVGRNPKTGEEVSIDARNSVKFKPSKELVESLN